MAFYYSHFHIIISNYTFYNGLSASKAMLLLASINEMIILHKTSLLSATLMIFIAFLFFTLTQTKKKLKSTLIEKNSEDYLSNKKYQLYLLFFGVVNSIAEINYEIFSIKPKSLFLFNITTALFFLIIYVLSTKSDLLFRNIRRVFIVFYLVYFGLICKNLLFVSTGIIPVLSFIVTFYFAYTVLKPIKLYWFFTACTFSYIVSVTYFEMVPIKTAITLFNFSLIVFTINYIQYIVALNVKDKFRFSDQIINNGNSLVIVSNRKGEILFCSETINPILGYSVDEVIGMLFWKVTEDEEHIGSKFHDNSISEKPFIRKLKTKNGEYKHIEWRDKRYTEDLIIGIGHEVTQQIKTQKRYENLVESAYDIISELDRHGNYIFINKNSELITGFTLAELFNSKFEHLIKDTFQQSVRDFYGNSTEKIDSFPILEFPIIKKNGDEIWLSQKVTINKDEDLKIIGYSVIARDITFLKNIEKEKTDRRLKNLKYSNALKSFTAKSYSNNESFDSKLKMILEIATKTIGVGRSSYWNCFEDKIVCQQLFEFKSRTFSNNFEITKKSFPRYFLTIKNKLQIVASDVYTNDITNELCVDYFPKNNIFSILDTPVFINGELKGIVCFEATEEVRRWDNEDINFSRSVSDIIAIAFESKMRLEIQNKLTYKSELLAAMAKCTEKFLISKDIDDIFTDVLIIMGKATKSHRTYYYEHDTSTNLISQKYRWKINNTSLTENNPNLQDLPFAFFEELLPPLLNNKTYEATVSKIENKSLKDKLVRLDVISLILFPIFIKNEFHGFLGFDDTSEEKKWSEDEINILQTLARNITSSIERIQGEIAIYESEEKFRLLANNIPGAVYLSNNDEKYTKIYLNDEIKKLTGYDKAEFLEKRVFYTDLIHIEDYDQVVDESLDKLSKSEPFHLTYRIINKNGTVVWVEEFGDAIINNGKISYIEGIMLDITERKMAEDAIKSLEYAEAANKAKSEFLANISHEFRTPLNGIIGFTDLLMKTKLEEVQEKHMITVNQSAHSLLGIVNDILDFSKIEAKKLDLHIEKHKIKDILNPIMDLILYESNQKNLHLELSLALKVPVYFWVDSIRLKQILINLLANAVKFTEVGFVKLDISLLKTANSTTTVRFAVLDSGIGILKENQTKIFKAFSQEDSSTTKKFGGTGLGLTISNKLLELMESHLQLSSEIGIGSTFYFDLDLQTTDDNEVETALEIDKDDIVVETFAFHSNDRLETVKIMLVEDNKINMLLLKTIIRNVLPKAIIHEISNGLNAVNEYENILPDIIFMDIQMPLMNGYEATKEIRKLKSGATIPIIAITAGTEVEINDKCIAAGMNDYISKPIIKRVIEDALVKWTTHLAQ